MSGIDVFDVTSLVTLRALVGKLDPFGPPTFAPLRPTKRANVACLIPGSFDPPTLAHVSLAERMIADGADQVWFVLSKDVLGKDRGSLTPDDRLLVMRAACGPSMGVAVASHGLISEQVRAASKTLDASELVVAIGSDKLEQLFDPVWYEDREESLDELFALATVVVAPRQADVRTVERLIEQNDRWANRISIARLHPSVADVSSTQVRHVMGQGLEPAGWVPEPVIELLQNMGAYRLRRTPVGEVDLYELRQRLVGVVIDGRCTRDGPDLRKLWSLALDPGPGGRELRELLELRVT